MPGRSLWVLAVWVALTATGCGLISDLAPPDPVPDGGAVFDASIADAATRDAARPDAAVFDAAVFDAGALDATAQIDAEPSDAEPSDAEPSDAEPSDAAATSDAFAPDAGDRLYPPSNLGDRSFWSRGGGVVATREDGCYCSVLNADTGEIEGMARGDRAPGIGLDPTTGIYFEVVTQVGAPDLGVFVLEELTVRSPFQGDGLYVQGDNAVVLLVRGTVEIDGYLGPGNGTLGYLGGQPGSPGAGPSGGRPSDSAAQGGGGGGFGGAGGDGSGAVAGGPARGEPRLVPLRHGSGGGGGHSGAGGRGGRAIQISALDRILASPASLIDVRGAGGEPGGGGGGAGGAVLLEAPVVELAGRITANGGGGGSCSARGDLGEPQVSRARGAEGCEGRGGDGGGADVIDGGDASEGTAGAGGGGAAGRIRVNANVGSFTGLETSPLRGTAVVSFGPLP